MRDHGEELGYPGGREILERALHGATTQVLRLAPDTGPTGRSLLERGADALCGFDLVPADAYVPSDMYVPADPRVPVDMCVPADPCGQPAAGDPEAVAAASRDGIPSDIAEAYIRAKTAVKAILAEHAATPLAD